MAAAFDPATRHPQFERRASQWRKMAVTVEGEDAVKAAGEEYLPRLSSQSRFQDTPDAAGVIPGTSYEAYRARASFPEAVERTRDGLVGAVERKPVDVAWPGDEAFLDGIGVGRESLAELISDVLDAAIGIGRIGVLVDANASESAGGTVRPFAATYDAQAITDWEEDWVEVGGEQRKEVVRVNLREAPRKSADGKRNLESYRVLRLGVPAPDTADEAQATVEDFLSAFGLTVEDFAGGPIYFQEVWVEVDRGETQSSADRQWARESLVAPRKMGGALWQEIPFTFFNSGDTKSRPAKPLLFAVANLALSHYRNSADLEHGLHFTALPQVWLAGFKMRKELVIGSGSAWASEDPNAKAGYLEFSGSGLGAISARMEAKEKAMAVQGAKILEPQRTSGVESAETVKLRHAGEDSALAKTAGAVSRGLTRVLRHLAEFMGLADAASASCKLNTNFGTRGLSAQELVALMQQVQAGVMSWPTYFWNVKQADLIPDGTDEEDERRQLKEGPPGDVGLGSNPNADPQRDDDEGDDDEGDDDEGDDDEGEGDDEMPMDDEEMPRNDRR